MQHGVPDRVVTKVLQTAGIHRHPMWKDQGRGFQVEIHKNIAICFRIARHKLRTWRRDCTVDNKR
jgi:hypothetical protein